MAERTEESVTAGLGVIAGALRADGYDLHVERAGERLAVRIDALDGACEECLSPAAVLSTLISTALEGLYEPDEIDIAYPG